MKVLIVDDEPLVRRSLGRALKSRGHEVQEADNGLTGLAMWKADPPQVMLLDVLMPGLTGPQVLQEMREQQPQFETKVVLISAFTGEHNMESAQQMGASLFIPKPFADIFNVVDIVEKLVLTEGPI